MRLDNINVKLLKRKTRKEQDYSLVMPSERSNDSSKDKKVQFSKEIEDKFKSKLYLRMESMIENVRIYQQNFKGSRVPTYEQKFIEARKQLLLERERDEANSLHLQQMRRRRHMGAQKKRTVPESSATLTDEHEAANAAESLVIRNRSLSNDRPSTQLTNQSQQGDTLLQALLKKHQLEKAVQRQERVRKLTLPAGPQPQRSYLAVKRIQNFSSKSPASSSTKKIHHDSQASSQVPKQNKPNIGLNPLCMPQQSSQKKRIINFENQIGN